MLRFEAVRIAFLLLLLASPARAAAEADAIAAAVKEKSGAEAAGTRVSGEWALADEITVSDGTRAKSAQAVVRKVNDRWVVMAELAGSGQATAEALEYHDVPQAQADKLLDARTRDEQKPIVTLLRLMMPDRYPQGALLETVAIADNWALCCYRHRAGIKKNDTAWQALLRKTDGKWHLVERADHPVDLRQYGVPPRLQKTLSGQSL